MTNRTHPWNLKRKTWKETAKINYKYDDSFNYYPYCDSPSITCAFCETAPVTITPLFPIPFVRHSWRSAHEGSLRDPPHTRLANICDQNLVVWKLPSIPKNPLKKNLAGRARLSETASKTAPYTGLFTDCLGGRFTNSEILKIFCCQSTFWTSYRHG